MLIDFCVRRENVMKVDSSRNLSKLPFYESPVHPQASKMCFISLTVKTTSTKHLATTQNPYCTDVARNCRWFKSVKGCDITLGDRRFALEKCCHTCDLFHLVSTLHPPGDAAILESSVQNTRRYLQITVFKITCILLGV